MQTFLRTAIASTLKPKQRYCAEEILYDQCTYPMYLKTRLDFNIAMKGGKLKRADILKIKKLLNKALNMELRKYNSYKFKNDAHEIYTKLKNKRLTKRKLKKIDRKILKMCRP